MAALSRLQKPQGQFEKQTEYVEQQEHALADMEVKQALLKADLESARVHKTEL